jgi:class 3 adenylate cyclase
MSGYTEKRTHERYDYDAPIEHAESNSGEFTTARMGNYSRSGMRFYTDQTLSSGSDISIRMEDNPPPLYDFAIRDECRAQVKWCRERADLSHPRYSVGIQYYTPIIEYSDKATAAIDAKCPKCRTENTMGTRQCAGCGYDVTKQHPVSLMGQPDPASYTPKNLGDKLLSIRRRIEGKEIAATALFTDVAGFTTVSTKFGRKDVHHIMDGYFQILMSEVTAHEGTIIHFTEGGVLAMFGSPLTLKNHARNAGQAALSMQKTLQKYQRYIEASYDLDFKVRIGMNSGPVIIDTIHDDLRIDYTAVGDTTRLAARLEGLADPGGILVSVNVYDQISPLIKCDHLGKIYVKGQEEPVYIYEIDSSPSARN